MSVRVAMLHTVEVGGEGARLATVRDDDVNIWPAGLGQGPVISMSRDDWIRISREVKLAYMRAEGKAP